MEKYERCFTLGWGIAGNFLSGARRNANILGCDLKIEPAFLSLAPLNTVRLTASGGQLDKFKDYMDLIGQDQD